MAFLEVVFFDEAAPSFLRRSLKRLWYRPPGKAEPFRTEERQSRETWRIDLHGVDYS